MSTELTTRLLDAIDKDLAKTYRDNGRRHRMYTGLRTIVTTVSGWRHGVVDDCWYTCPAATEERDGGECCDDGRRGGPCDCGLDTRRGQILAAVAKALGVGV